MNCSFVKPFLIALLVSFLAFGCAGRRQQPQHAVTGAYEAEGMASWYGKRFHGRKTASGERFNQNALTCAHRTLPFGSRLKVTNLDNHQEVEVRVNDRGPFIRSRIVDLSRAAAKALDFLGQGMARVRLQLLSP